MQRRGRLISKGRGKGKRADERGVRRRLGREVKRVSQGQEAMLYTGAVEIVESRKHQERESEVTLFQNLHDQLLSHYMKPQQLKRCAYILQVREHTSYHRTRDQGSISRVIQVWRAASRVYQLIVVTTVTDRSWAKDCPLILTGDT